MTQRGDEVRIPDSLDADRALGYEPDVPEQAPIEGDPAETDELTDNWWETTEEASGEEQQQPQEEQPEPNVEETVQPETEEQPDPLIFGKYRSLDEAQKGHENLQSTLGRQSQELGILRQQVQTLTGILQGNIPAPQQQLTPGAQQPQMYGQQSVPAQQQIQPKTPEQMWEKLAENPEAVIDELVNRRVAQERAVIGQAMQNMIAPLQPIMRSYQQQQMVHQLESAYKQQVDTLAAKYPDFGQYKDEMRKRIAASPGVLNAPDAFEVLYKAVKLDATTKSAVAQTAKTQKQAARLPQGNTQNVKKTDNDALVDEALGPMTARSEWD